MWRNTISRTMWDLSTFSKLPFMLLFPASVVFFLHSSFSLSAFLHLRSMQAKLFHYIALPSKALWCMTGFLDSEDFQLFCNRLLSVPTQEVCCL